MATQNSIVITWRTDIACNSKVMYGTSLSAFAGGVVNNNLVTEHVIKLTTLNPATKYYYTIGTSTLQFQGNAENCFKTLPLTSSAYEKPIRILAVGDVAKANSNEEHVRDAFIQYVDTNYVDGYLMLGDNSYPSGYDVNFQDGFFNYFQHTITKHTVLWPATGNHEYANDYSLRQSHAISYFDIFTLPTQGECGGVPSNTEMYYSFNIGNVHFVNLDSYGLEEVAGNYYGISDTAYAPQIHWLKQDLHANTLPWVIVSFHHPPYCLGTHNSDIETDLIAIREKLTPILERYNVDLVLNGHCHTYQRSNFIHQHTGLEASYDTALHRLQHSSGLNDTTAFSCPFIKNSNPPLAADSGLLYVVIGSGSDYVSSPQPTWPHAAMYYSNFINSGSLLLTIEGTQLLGEWISTDTNQVVKDHFTIYKNVNRKNHVSAIGGQPITLTASWNKENDYVWSTGDSTKQITISPTSFQVLTVTDKKGCVTDSFFISMAAPNQINESVQHPIVLSPNPVKNQLKIEGLVEGNYSIKLMDAKGAILLRQDSIMHKADTAYLLPLSQIANGQYMLDIEKDGLKVSNHRIVVSH